MSDSRSKGENPDLSGPAAAETLQLYGFSSFYFMTVPDEVQCISNALLELCCRCEAIFTTGGTGFTPRDVTPEATSAVLDKRADNLSELLRAEGLKHTPYSYLSRGIAGMRGKTLIVNLPGSPSAVRQGIDALAPLLPAILSALQGEGCTAHD